MSGPWKGRSLAFARQLTDQPARYPDAAQAAAASSLDTTGPVPLGAFCWYEQEPYGNVAIALGSGLVLAITGLGYPGVLPGRDPWLGTYLGWSRTIGPER